MLINEIFLSIQGEGVETGLPTIFIRTTGCNLRCAWCDTKYGYEEGEEMSIEEIEEEIEKYPFNRVCLTGGEPLCQRGSLKLINELLLKGYYVNLETNGSLPIPASHPRLIRSVDCKCPSSGMSDRMLYDNITFLEEQDQLKFVLKDVDDYEFARRKIIQNLKPKANIIFTPVNGLRGAWIVERVLEDRLDVRVMGQLHKVFWTPGRRRV